MDCDAIILQAVSYALVVWCSTGTLCCFCFPEDFKGSIGPEGAVDVKQSLVSLGATGRRPGFMVCLCCSCSACIPNQVESLSLCSVCYGLMFRLNFFLLILYWIWIF